MSEETYTEEQETKPGEYNTEDLFTMQMDEEKSDKMMKDLLLGSGGWITVPPLKFTHKKVKIRDEDGNDTDEERMVSRTFTKIQRTIKDKKSGELVEEKGAIPLALSPTDRKNAKNKWDNLTRLRLAARNTAKKTEGSGYDGSYGSIIRFLEEYPVGLRVIQTQEGNGFDAGNMVVNIYKLRDA